MRIFASARICAALLAASVAAGGAAADAGSSRIVAIGGSLTEIVYALGEQDRLVARDTTGTYPPEAEKLPDVGYMRALSPEGVLSVDPDLIIALEGSGPPEAVSVLEEADVPFVMIPESFDRAGIVDKIVRTGRALGVEEKAAALAGEVERELLAAEKTADAVSDRLRVLFVLSTRGGKVMASGTGTAADAMIRMAGAENAIGEFAGYKQLTDEAVILAAPDAIVMMDRGGDHGAADSELFAMPAIAPTPAARNRRAVRMNGLYLLGFGPRTAEAVRDLHAALYRATTAHTE